MDLLILACSATKRNCRTKAVDLYDGPFYKVLRKHTYPELEVVILSAKYGILQSQEVIPPYEKLMTSDRAKELAPDVKETLIQISCKGEYNQVFVEMGKIYEEALPDDLEDMFDCKVVKDFGQIGYRLSHFKAWLTRNRSKGRRAGRLFHAVAVNNPGSGDHGSTYSRLDNNTAGIPTNLLISFYYIRRKTKVPQRKILEAYKKCTHGGRLYVDSGVFTLMGQHTEGEKIKFEEIKDYTTDYVKFLNSTEDLWDLAFDVDADIVIGSQKTDQLHRYILDQITFSPGHIIRVYHTVRENVEEWWRLTCKNSPYTTLAIEFVGHRWNPKFYRPLIDIAHKYGKKVHALGATSLNFVKRVPADTFDSSSHLTGGRYGEVYFPCGKVSFGTKKKENHYSLLDTKTKTKVDRHIFGYGMHPNELDNRYNRVLINMWLMNDYWDRPFVETKRQLDLFRGVHFENE